jgi:hypothetical protein
LAIVAWLHLSHASACRKYDKRQIRHWYVTVTYA